MKKRKHKKSKASITYSLHDKAIYQISQNNLIEAESFFLRSFRADEPLARKSLLCALWILNQRGDREGGMALLREASVKMDDPAMWLASLAEKYMASGDFSSAIETVDEALRLDPGHAVAFINRACWLAGRMGDCTESKNLFEAWGRQFADPISDAWPKKKPRELLPNERLRVGYVSGDFKNHSVRYFIEPYLHHHNREDFEVHAFMTLPEDEITEYLKTYVDAWSNVSDLDDEDFYHLIQEKKIDILVDLSGHTAGERLMVFARQPAPVQVTWMGFMQTLGMRAMTWRLTDPGATPLGSQDFYTERLKYLSCMVAYAPPLNCDEQFTAPFLANGYVTMICLNHNRKISDSALNLWGQILSANINAGLIIISSDYHGDDDSAIRKRAELANIPMDQFMVHRRMNMTQFMRIASIADFALDTFPVSGGTTTLHALWMGLPTLALHRPERGAMNSATGGILTGVGLPECVVADEREYVQRASEWIENPDRIVELRAKCRQQLQSSDLMNYQDRVAELERAYREMWQSAVDDSQ